MKNREGIEKERSFSIGVVAFKPFFNRVLRMTVVITEHTETALTRAGLPVLRTPALIDLSCSGVFGLAELLTCGLLQRRLES